MRILAAFAACFAAAFLLASCSRTASHGANAQLTQQIENGAPCEVLLAADVEHVDELVRRGAAIPDSRTIYARGRLVVWAPKRPQLRTLDALTRPDIRTIAVAKPEPAPYGASAIETLKKAGIWSQVAKQFGDTGNADAAFTAFALLIGEADNYFAVDEKLHQRIDPALCITKYSAIEQSARAFVNYLASPEGQSVLTRFGYAKP